MTKELALKSHMPCYMMIQVLRITAQAAHPLCLAEMHAFQSCQQCGAEMTTPSAREILALAANSWQMYAAAKM